MQTAHARIRVLVVEDNISLAENLFEFFQQDHYVLDFAPDGMTALHLLSTNEYDVIILDVMLPGVSGFDICRRLRTDLQCTTPVIMMTAKDQLQDKEVGFQHGADDYLVKPFHLRELQLRVDALCRRKLRNTSRLVVDSLTYDPGTLTVTWQGDLVIQLGGTMAAIFEILIRAYPNFVSYQQLQETLWGDRELDVHVLRTHIYTLRKQLQERARVNFIKTIHGRGYQLVLPDKDS